MLLTYLDESYTQRRYLIAAVLVPDVQARSLTAALDDIVESVAREHDVANDAELHGYDLVAGKADWLSVGGKVRVRIGVYSKAIQAIADHQVAIILRSVDIAGLARRYPAGHAHPHSIVMTHLVERVDEYAAKLDQYALLIADEVDGQDTYRKDLWHYQRLATWGYRSRQISRVVDTMDFAPSSSSRLVQAADLVAYLARRRATHIETDHRAKRAFEALWARLQPRIEHDGCWWPMPH